MWTVVSEPSLPTKDDLLGDYPLNAVKAILRQSGRYGEQVRLLQDAGELEDRLRVRKAWRAFLEQFETNNNLWWHARASYNDGYSARGTIE